MRGNWLATSWPAPAKSPQHQHAQPAERGRGRQGDDCGARKDAPAFGGLPLLAASCLLAHCGLSVIGCGVKLAWRVLVSARRGSNIVRRRDDGGIVLILF